MNTAPAFSEAFNDILKGKVRCPKYIDSIYDILDYLVWLRINGYEGGYGCDSLDEDDNHRIIAYQTNAMFDCVMDTYYPDEDRTMYENKGEHIISCLDEWVDHLFDQ